MNDYFGRFQAESSRYFSRGNRNNNFPAVARLAVIYEVDEGEATAYVKGQFGSDWTKSDEASWKRALEKAKKDSSIVPISEYKREKAGFDFVKFAKDVKKQEASIAEEVKAAEAESNFSRWLEKTKEKTDIVAWLKKSKPHLAEDSTIMLKLFSEDDLVWMNRDAWSTDLKNEVKDIRSFAEKKKPLSSLNFFCINPLKDDTSRSDENVKEFKYMLLESDSLAKSEQFIMAISMIESGVPVKAVTFTGNKSLHILIAVNGIKTKEQWDEYAESIFSALNSLKDDLFDEKCKNASRLSRTPGAIRCDDKTDFEDKKQTLMYLSEDPDLLREDARERLLAWVDGIKGKDEISTTPHLDDEDEIGEDELLFMLKDRDRINDIWDDGCCIHTLMKSPYFGLNGEVLYKTEDMMWRSERSFYSFMQQVLEEQYGVKVDCRELKSMKIRHKKHEKYPFIGERSPVKKDIVNVFIPGWLHKALSSDRIPSELNEPLEKFLDNIFGEQEQERVWTLQWMREFMHTFSVITAPVFWEVPGTGKTMLSKAFGEAIGDWIKTPPKKDDIQFNAWQDHTVIIFEESSSGSKRDGKDLGDLLKDWITEPEKTIEAKGKDPVKKTIKSCFIFNANISEQIGPVHIEDDDRRYTIIRNDEAKNLIDIWTREDFEKWDSGEYQMQLMKWIYNLPKDDSVNIRKGLDNAWKHQVIEMSKTQLEIAVCDVIPMLSGFVSGTEIMNKIKNDIGIMNVTTQAIGRIMAKLGYKSKVKNVLGQVKRGYELNSSVVVEDGEVVESKVAEGIDVDSIF